MTDYSTLSEREIRVRMLKALERIATVLESTGSVMAPSPFVVYPPVAPTTWTVKVNTEVCSRCGATGHSGSDHDV